MNLMLTFVFALLALGILVLGPCLLVIVIVRASRGPKNQSSPDEARVIQEIHRGLSKLEERVEVLETILVEAERRRNHEETYSGEGL